MAALQEIFSVLLRFADTLSESANRAALGFRAALAQEPLAGVEEVAAALASVYLRFDPAKSSYATLHGDGKTALETALAVRSALEAAGMQLCGMHDACHYETAFAAVIP